MTARWKRTFVRARRVQINCDYVRAPRFHPQPFCAHVEMPPKAAFTLERLQACGASAAEDARDRHANVGGAPCEQLTCEYRGLAKEDEEHVTNENPTGRSISAYVWHACVGGHHDEAVVKLRCDDVVRRGVPFPKHWHTALRCANLQAVGDEAAKAARDELGGEIACKLLGVAKRTTLPELGEHKPGSTVLLAGDGPRMAHLLCAHIDGDTWLCHRGSFEDGKLNETDPLSYHDLVAV